MKSVAAQVPTSLEELAAIGVLGENLIKVYGERLIENIQNFVQTEGLEELLQNSRPAKRTKTASTEGAVAVPAAGKSSKVVEIVSDDDEFDSGIDFSAIELSESKPPSTTTTTLSNGGSRYFR